MLEPALLFAVFFGPLAFGCVESWSLAILQAVLFSLPLLSWLKHRRPPRTAPRSLLIGVGVLLLLGIAQALNPSPPNGPVPLLPFTASSLLTKRALILWASYFALLWAAPQAFTDSRAINRFAWAIVLIGVTVAVIGLIQAAHGNTHVLGFRKVPYGRSPFGPYYNNAHAASLLAVSSLVGLGLLGSRLARALGRPRSDGPLADELAIPILLAFLLCLIMMGLLATHNRGSLLAFGGALLVVGFLACGLFRRATHRWGARAVLITLFLAGAGTGLHLKIINRGAALSVPYRISMYKSGLRLLSDVPLWGTGLGTVVAVFEPYKDSLIVGIVDHVHNDWLEMPLQTGIPAAAVMLAALLIFGRRIHRGWMLEPSMEKRLLVGGGVAASLCFFLHAFVEFAWQIPANAVIFLLVLCWLWRQTGGHPRELIYTLPVPRALPPRLPNQA